MTVGMPAIGSDPDSNPERKFHAADTGTRSGTQNSWETGPGDRPGFESGAEMTVGMPTMISD